MVAHRSFVFSFLLALSGCEGAPADSAGAIPDYATAPSPPAGSMELRFPETTVEAGKEVQNCHYLEPLKEDLYVSALKSYQGKFGHHLVLFRTTKEYPPGTLRDCTSIDDMLTLTPIISSVNFGLEKFPEGMAVRVPAGSQMVLQQHYLNTGSRPVTSRDVTHLKVMQKGDVKIIAGFYGTANVTFRLKPSAQEEEVPVLCTVPRDMNILLVGPHMHEWGLRISVEAGPAGAMQKLMEVNPWHAEYRDQPPTKEFKLENPLVLRKGDKLLTRCVFKNTSGADLYFPSEMCSTYGYYYPAPLGSEPWICDGMP